MKKSAQKEQIFQNLNDTSFPPQYFRNFIDSNSPDFSNFSIPQEDSPDPDSQNKEYEGTLSDFFCHQNSNEPDSPDPKARPTNPNPKPTQQKKKKKTGRKKISEKFYVSKTSERKTHNKFFLDNLLRKIKKFFHDFVLNFVNGAIKIELEKQQSKKRLKFRSISSNIVQNINILFNKRLFNSTVGNFLDNELNKKFKKKDKNSNKKNLEKIYKDYKLGNLHHILNYSLKSFYINCFLDKQNPFDSSFQKLFEDANIRCLDQAVEEVLKKTNNMEYCETLKHAGRNGFIHYFEKGRIKEVFKEEE